MGLTLRTLLLLFIQLMSANAAFVRADSSTKVVINVQDHGARGDGTDATEAFAEAWKEACASRATAILKVPERKEYLLKPITFSGPCKSSVVVDIRGTLEASSDRSDWKGKDRKRWIVFKGIQGLHVHGGGTINGNGRIWWENSCKINKKLPCTSAPTAITFHTCNNLDVNNLKIKDSQKMHVSFEGCANVRVSRLTITAPERSPNTDGIHVTRTKNIKIKSCVIGTGDDCISIVNHSQKVRATDITCGPGHGISIGSLGSDNSEDSVSDVVVDTAKLSGTTNGVRIKTWQGGRGHAKDIVFRNIIVDDVKYPIIIDQNYCDSKKPCKQQKSAVAVSNVLYRNIKGTSATNLAMKFDCSKHVPCTGIVLEDVNLVGEEGKATKTFCRNVKLAKSGKIVPTPCD